MSRPWPEERSRHAACCLNYGQQFPQLLMTGGGDRQNKPLGDVWILDIERGNWRMVRLTYTFVLCIYCVLQIQVVQLLEACHSHTLTAYSLGPRLTVVFQFGGTLEPLTLLDESQRKMADNILLHFSECD